MQKNKNIFIADKKDLLEILKIYNQSFHPWKLDDLLTLFENGAKCYVFVNEKKIAGFILFKTVFNETEIISVAVDEKNRNQGVGAKLLEYLFDTLGSPAYVFLEVRVSNENAIALYKKYGMRQINIRKNYYNNPIEDALIYQKNL